MDEGWRFKRDRAPIYRNILEEFRLKLWELVCREGMDHGWTVTIPDSQGLIGNSRML